MCCLWEKHYGQCLIATKNCFGCDKDGNKVRDFPTIVAKGKEGNQVPYVLWAMMLKREIISMHFGLGNRSQKLMIMMLVSYSFFFLVDMISF